MRPVSRQRDPAPSRLRYRMQRLLLTPAFWFFLRFGLPLSVMALAAGLYASDQDRRDQVVDAVAELRRKVEQRPEFMVNLMAIDGATPHVADRLRETIPFDFPLSSFDLNLEEVRARTLELDAIEDASVHLRSGGVLQIDVIERTPAVVWRSRTGLALLDATGAQVDLLTSRAERADLPLLVGEGAETAVPEAIVLLTLTENLTPRVRGLLRVGARRWDVVLESGPRILLPETGAPEALQSVIALDAVRGLLARDLIAVDMRNPRRPTLRMGEDAVAVLQDPKEPAQ
jgi:cell division protein FtsQ